MKKLIASISVLAMLCTLTFGSALALTTTDTTAGARRGFGAGTQKELTEEQKVAMEAKRAQQQEKLDAFVATLTSEQKALYEAMKPAATEGQAKEKPDEAAMAAIKAKEEAFVASLTDAQKAQYEELCSREGNRVELTEEQKAQMEAKRAQYDEKLNAFPATLTSEQKAAYEAMTPQRPAEGAEMQKPDSASMTDMHAQRQAQLEAFLATLTDAQKVAYEELKSMGGFGVGRMK